MKAASMRLNFAPLACGLHCLNGGGAIRCSASEFDTRMGATEVRINARQRRRAAWLVGAGLGMLVVAILLLNLVPAHDNSLLRPHARKVPAAALPADEKTAAPASEPSAATN